MCHIFVCGRSFLNVVYAALLSHVICILMESFILLSSMLHTSSE